MKIKIIFPFEEGPYGGGNQFLKALKEYFLHSDLYSEYTEKSDIILFNSFHDIAEVAKLRMKFPEKIFVHRVDGPTRLYNNLNDKRDLITNKANDLLSDATIFQSNWSKEANISLGLKRKRFESTISNAPDPSIFSRKENNSYSMHRKTKLIATSWSSNIKKGFKVYKWMDENIDFSRYEMIFVGNTSYSFQNIRVVPPVNSIEIARYLKQSDIFITASEKDPCSNSLIEALHCGLPVLYYNDGGHPEIVKGGGLSFNLQAEIPEKIEEIRLNYDDFQKAISVPSIDTIGSQYHAFFQFLIDQGCIGTGKFGYLSYINIMLYLIYVKFCDKTRFYNSKIKVFNPK